MARPKSGYPTTGELEVLKILWNQGPSTVRQVLEVLNQRRRRHYTSVMSLMNVMTDKGQLSREPQGRAFLYRPEISRERASGQLLEDLLGRAFEGSAQALVARLLDRSRPSPAELAEIRRMIDQYTQEEEED